MEYSNVVLENPVDLDKIVEGNIPQNDISLTKTKKTVLSWDAREVSENQDIANAIYKVAKLSNYSEAKLYSETDSNKSRNKSLQSCRT